MAFVAHVLQMGKLRLGFGGRQGAGRRIRPLPAPGAREPRAPRPVHLGQPGLDPDPARSEGAADPARRAAQPRARGVR
jgi:hypothetical protein